MAVDILGIDAVTRQLRRTADRTSKRQLQALREGTEDITQRAKDYAPVDEGNLEEAITSVATRTGTFNRRIEFMIGVDKSKLGPGKNVYGYDYDVFMHEGVYKLGPKSIAKQSASGYRVGSKYLERAVQDFEASLVAEMERIVREEVR